jgi:hypothetical protein
MLLTRKMKNTTVCTTCLRSLFVWSSGRMSSMLAPVVPMKLAIRAPNARIPVFVRGCAARFPFRLIPPLIT